MVVQRDLAPAPLLGPVLAVDVDEPEGSLHEEVIVINTIIIIIMIITCMRKSLKSWLGVMPATLKVRMMTLVVEVVTVLLITPQWHCCTCIIIIIIVIIIIIIIITSSSSPSTSVRNTPAIPLFSSSAISQRN